MEREVRYCTTEDGVRIAYCVAGEGPPLLVCPATLESFSLHHIVPEVEDFLRQIGTGRTLIFYDMRSTGLSQRNAEDLSIDATILDMSAVASAAAVDRFAIWSSTTGGARAIAYAARNPERVSALVLYSTFARARSAMTEQALQAFEALATSNWEMFCQMAADMGASRAQQGDCAIRYAKMDAQSADGPTMVRFIRQNRDVDVTALLPTVKARTLVIHRVADSVLPVAFGQAIAAGIPGARLVTPPGQIRGYMWGDVESITAPINAFLDEDPETRRIVVPEAASPVAPRPFRAVLFTDLVDHTEMMSRLGDERGRAVLREHEAITRQVLKQHAGTEVKTMGDGFMASFGSVTKAVECAVALQRAFEARNRGESVDRGVGADHAAPPRASASGQTPVEPLNVRVGLNAGEPIEEEGDLFGATVILASRIAAKAEGGEILVADTVRGLCSGKGFSFTDRGEFTAKGFNEPVRVYEVNWQE